jgi:hypothetical protein
MGVLVWLAVPAAITLIAVGWVNWTSRARGPVGTSESLAERERFKAAFTGHDASQRRVS